MEDCFKTETKITEESLIEYGFFYQDDVLKYRIENFRIEYEKGNIWGDLRLEADGGYDDNGTFCLDHFKSIEDIDRLIKALRGERN